MKLAYLLMGGAIAAMTPALASAETMTFDGLPTSISGPATYSEGNITVTSDSGLFWAWPSDGQLHMDPSGFAGPKFTFTFASGAFNASSIDISYTSSGTLTFSGFDAGNALVVSQAFVAPTGTLDLSAFAGIYSLVMVDTADHISVDNFVATGAGAVPEPASWALMLAGFGALGFAMRGRKATNVSFA